MGIGTYFAQEGVFEFGAKSWGPQPARLIMSATACNGFGLAVARDTGVKEIKDLRGKRVATVVGSPALTQGVLALIAFADLTEKDVTLVPFPSNNAMWKGIINNEADVALSSTISGQSKEAGDFAARHPVAAPAGRRQGRLGAGPQEGALLHAA